MDCMMKNDIDEIKVSEKHVGLRVVLFIVAVAVAVGAFSYGITSLGRKESGYQLIEAATDADAPFYNREISFSYYLEGSSGAIKKATKELSAAYTPMLAAAYKELDPSTEYSGSVSIGAINNHLGEEVGVSAALYSVLKDAYARTLEGRNFNMFAGALYDEWRSVLILDDPVGFDPSTNDLMAERFALIAEEVSNLDNFKLEFLDDERHIVRFGVSSHYADFCEEMEITAGALDLNVLTNAYRLEMLVSSLEGLGFVDGYLLSQDGLAVTLSGCRRQGYALYGYDWSMGASGESDVSSGDGEEVLGSVVERGVFFVEGASSKAFMSAFAFGGYYNAVVDGRLRHLFFDVSTGDIHDVVMSCTIVSADGNIVDDMADIAYLCSLPSKVEVLSEVSSLEGEDPTLFVDISFQDGTDHVSLDSAALYDSILDSSVAKEVL